MRIRLLRAWIHSIKKFPIGTVLRVHNSEAKKKIMRGEAEEYKGEYPPKKKMKMNLSTIK